MKVKISIILIILLIPSLIFSQNFAFSEITSTTFLTQDLESSTPDIEVYTAKDIEMLGVNNIPDLLNLISGVNIFKLNKSTVDISIRGFPAILKITPKILIDGMEISENVYNRTYLYNLPVDISDIERIEVVKNTTITGNGENNISGIINIVTKYPENLDANYIYQEFGSKFYKKTYFSLNRYLNDFYIKFNTSFRQVDENEKELKHLSNFFSNLTIDRYFSQSKLTLKSSYLYEDLNFIERGIVAVPLLHRPEALKFRNLFKNMKFFNILLDYKMKNLDISLYNQSYRGDVWVAKKKKGRRYAFTNNNFTKFYIKKDFNFKKIKIKTGLEAKYRYAYILNTKSMKRYGANFFIENHIRLNKYLSFLGYINFDRTKDLGSKINYKIRLKFQNLNKDFSIRLGYSRSFQKPLMGMQYLKFTTIASPKTYDFLKKLGINQLPVSFISNKNLSSYQIKTSELSIEKRFKYVNLFFTSYYNLIYDIPSLVGGLKPFFQPEAYLYPVNYEDICIYGFDSKMEFNYKNYKFFTSYYHQLIKDKTHNSLKDFFVPREKLNGALLFKYNSINVSISGIYYPSVKFHYGKSDSYFSLNTSFSKYFFNNRLKTSIYVSNIINDIHKDDKFGKKQGREVYLRIQYDF